MDKVTVEEWNRVMNINVQSVFLSYKVCIPFMRENGGSFVNISSMVGLVGNSGQGLIQQVKGLYAC